MLAGGELARQLTASQRMQMVEKGFSPLNPRDVKAFMNNQKPTGSLALAAGVHDKQFSSLGMSRASANDLRLGASEYDLDTSLLDQDSVGFLQDELSNNGLRDYAEDASPREQVNRQLNSRNTNEFTDLSDKLQNRLSMKRSSSQGGSYPDGFTNDDNDEIEEEFQLSNIIKQPKKVLTDKKKVVELGLTKGINYCNCFLTNLKDPSVANRTKLINALNNMIISEDSVHPQLLKYYQHGIATAEKMVLDKLKSK
jgi:hypothetical protein